MVVTTGWVEIVLIWAFCVPAFHNPGVTTTERNVPALPELAIGHGCWAADEALRDASWEATPGAHTLRSVLHLAQTAGAGFHVTEAGTYELGVNFTVAPEEQGTARDQHCASYTGFLQRRKADLIGAGTAEALAEIRAEIANMRAAWQWAVKQTKIQEIER